MLCALILYCCSGVPSVACWTRAGQHTDQSCNNVMLQARGRSSAKLQWLYLILGPSQRLKQEVTNVLAMVGMYQTKSIQSTSFGVWAARSTIPRKVWGHQSSPLRQVASAANVKQPYNICQLCTRQLHARNNSCLFAYHSAGALHDCTFCCCSCSGTVTV